MPVLGTGVAVPQVEEQSSTPLQQQKAVLTSLAVDPGLHPLMPYFSQLIAEQGRASLKSLPALHLLLQVRVHGHPSQLLSSMQCVSQRTLRLCQPLPGVCHLVPLCSACSCMCNCSTIG